MEFFFSCFLGNIERRGMKQRYIYTKNISTESQKYLKFIYLETCFPFLMDIFGPVVVFKNFPIMLVRTSISGMEVFPTENLISKVVFVTRMSCRWSTMKKSCTLLLNNSSLIRSDNLFLQLSTSSSSSGWVFLKLNSHSIIVKKKKIKSVQCVQKTRDLNSR